MLALTTKFAMNVWAPKPWTLREANICKQYHIEVMRINESDSNGYISPVVNSELCSFLFSMLLFLNFSQRKGCKSCMKYQTKDLELISCNKYRMQHIYAAYNIYMCCMSIVAVGKQPALNRQYYHLMLIYSVERMFACRWKKI